MSQSPIQDEGIWRVLNLSALGSVLGSLFDLLPKVAAAVGMILYIIMIWESKTVRNIRAWVKHEERKQNEYDSSCD